MKYSFLFIVVLLLPSCTHHTSNHIPENTPILSWETVDTYYEDLSRECALLPSYEKWFCDKSIVIMKKDWYKKATNNASWSLSCPEWMTIDGIKAIGAIMYCKPLSK